jgi:hypothetical protein
VDSRRFQPTDEVRAQPSQPREGLTVGYCPAPPGPRSWWGFYFRRLKPTAIHGVALRATRRNQEWPNLRVMPFGRRIRLSVRHKPWVPVLYLAKMPAQFFFGVLTSRQVMI